MLNEDDSFFLRDKSDARGPTERERHGELLRQWLDSAVGVARVEAYADRAIARDLSWADVEARIEGLKDETQLAVIEAVERYVKQCKSTRRSVERLRSLWHITESDEEEFSARFFEARAGRPPSKPYGRSNVRVKVAEGYVIVYVARRDPNPELDDYLCLSQGTSAPVRPKRGSVGEMHRAMSLSVGGETLPVLLVTIDQGVNPDFQQTLTHERQHFLHHNVLELFLKSEPAGRVEETDKDTSHEANMSELGRVIRESENRGFKDELLAFLRDGRGDKDLPLFLNNRNYPLWFNPRTEEIYSRILAELPTLLPEFDRPEARAILTHSLLNVPLERIPTRLRSLNTFLKRELVPRLPEDDVRPDVPFGAIFSPPRQSAGNEAADLAERYAFESSIGSDKITKTARELRRRWERVSEGISRDGVLVPYARVSRKYVKLEDEKRFWQRSRDVAARIVERLETVDQSVIDDVMVGLEANRSGSEQQIVRPILAAVRLVPPEGSGFIRFLRIRQSSVRDSFTVFLLHESAFGPKNQTIEVTLHASPARHETAHAAHRQRLRSALERQAERPSVLPPDFVLPDVRPLAEGEHVRSQIVEFPMRVAGRDLIGTVEIELSDRMRARFEARLPDTAHGSGERVWLFAAGTIEDGFGGRRHFFSRRTSWLARLLASRP